MYIHKDLPVSLSVWVGDSSMPVQVSNNPEVLLVFCDHTATKRCMQALESMIWYLVLHFWSHALPLDQGGNAVQAQALGKVVYCLRKIVSPFPQTSSSQLRNNCYHHLYHAVTAPGLLRILNGRSRGRLSFRVSFRPSACILFSLHNFLPTVATRMCVSVGCGKGVEALIPWCELACGQAERRLVPQRRLASSAPTTQGASISIHFNQHFILLL